MDSKRPYFVVKEIDGEWKGLVKEIDEWKGLWYYRGPGKWYWSSIGDLRSPWQAYASREDAVAALASARKQADFDVTDARVAMLDTMSA